jgi:hypothetical protein
MGAGAKVDDFAGSDEEEERDHYKERLKQEAKERQGSGDDDDGSESGEFWCPIQVSIFDILKNKTFNCEPKY